MRDIVSCINILGHSDLENGAMRRTAAILRSQKLSATVQKRRTRKKQS